MLVKHTPLSVQENVENNWEMTKINVNFRIIISCWSKSGSDKTDRTIMSEPEVE